MKKRNLCKLLTLSCGLLALILHIATDFINWAGHDARPIGIALGLVSAIFGAQWVEYQKRLDATASQPGWPVWLRRLLY
ncbi:hypothetical protein [Spirosoma utsteinense]|uniref:Membrane associated rhomboid family serine protease n=1 Tax=Spirosoma utsteinense TaxID=2585773 RepID=A0ABR6WD63_9BACT|nr:hypothetical protein [Spirosoma utsteinense]MBC3788759.1 membrane associated rhomboid family serine protease [Spirosoma utsteinense]MBC3794510.1 membrane associated rhomboid family serine protease [Spirosoma utsteinense]